MSRSPVAHIFTIVFLFMSACGGSGSSPDSGPGGNSGGGGTPGPQPASPHVAIVVLENTGYADVIGSPAMPWLNQLATDNALATNYYANTHPSIGNYFMMTTGQKVTDNDSFNSVVDVDNLVRQFSKDHKSWGIYADALPKAGYLGGNQGTYLKRHNPFAYFSDVVNDPAQAANIVPFSQLSADLTNKSLPDFLFIVPDEVHDAHSCPVGNAGCSLADRLGAADNWLKSNVQPLLTSSAFSSGVLVVTFDEAGSNDSTHGGGRIVTILAGAGVRPGFQSAELYQHQNLLSFVGAVLKLSAAPGEGANASPMPDMRQ